MMKIAREQVLVPSIENKLQISSGFSLSCRKAFWLVGFGVQAKKESGN